MHGKKEMKVTDICARSIAVGDELIYYGGRWLAFGIVKAVRECDGQQQVLVKTTGGSISVLKYPGKRTYVLSPDRAKKEGK